jgi:hypothetical protein
MRKMTMGGKRREGGREGGREAGRTERNSRPIPQLPGESSKLMPSITVRIRLTPRQEFVSPKIKGEVLGASQLGGSEGEEVGQGTGRRSDDHGVLDRLGRGRKGGREGRVRTRQDKDDETLPF